MFAQSSPIELHERVLPGDLANHLVGDARAVSQAGQMQLPHFSAAAHVVHQIEGVSFAANKSHLPLPQNTARNCSVPCFHYIFNKLFRFPAKNDSNVSPHEDKSCRLETLITFLALFHLFCASFVSRFSSLFP